VTMQESILMSMRRTFTTALLLCRRGHSGHSPVPERPGRAKGPLQSAGDFDTG